MFYLDSSVIVAAVTREESTPAVLTWMSGRFDNLRMSDWTFTEAVAAVSKKRRMDMISADDHSRSLAALQRHFLDGIECWPVRRAHFRRAAEFAGHFQSGLRGGDALHLGIAAANESVLATLDARQFRAGQTLGIDTLMLASA